MKDIEFEDWRLHIFWGAIAVTAGIAGFVFGWGWRDISAPSAGVGLLDALTALGTFSAVLAALWIAGRQRSDALAADAKAASVAYWLVHAEVVALRDIHFPVLDAVLSNIHRLADGEAINFRDAETLNLVAGRMSMDGTRDVMDKLHLLDDGESVAEVYGRLGRLKAQVFRIAEQRGGMEMALRESVRLNIERVQKLSGVLAKTRFR